MVKKGKRISKDTSGPSTVVSVKEDGVIFISTLGTFSNGLVEAEKLKKLRNNAYGRSLTMKTQSKVFERLPQIYVYDPQNNPAEMLQKRMTDIFMAPAVDYISKLKIAREERMWYGKSIFNHVWENVDGEIVLTKLRHLPAYSFDTCAPNRRQYTEILKGITYNPATKQVEYWQRQSEEDHTPVQLDSNAIIAVGDPADLELGGDPMIRPLVPILEMLSYTWDTEMQRINRVGAPIMFLKITKPQPASEKNGWVGDIEYAEKVLKFWGKNTAYPLRENMEPVWPEFKDSSSTTDVIYTLTHLLVDYCTPTGFVSKEGRLIGGASVDEGDNMWSYTRAEHRWLELAFQPLLNMYLELNGYEGYTAEIKFPTVGKTKSEIQLRQAELGSRTRTLTPSEVRMRLEAEPVDEKESKRIAKLWEEIIPDPRKLDKDNAMLPNSGLINAEHPLGYVARMDEQEAVSALNSVIGNVNHEFDQAQLQLLTSLVDKLRTGKGIDAGSRTG
jgi:hypothetical protein